MRTLGLIYLLSGVAIVAGLITNPRHTIEGCLVALLLGAWLWAGIILALGALFS